MGVQFAVDETAKPVVKCWRQQAPIRGIVQHFDDLAWRTAGCGAQVDAQIVAAAIGGEGNPGGVPPDGLDAGSAARHAVVEIAVLEQVVPRLPVHQEVRNRQERIVVKQIPRVAHLAVVHFEAGHEFPRQGDAEPLRQRLQFRARGGRLEVVQQAGAMGREPPLESFPCALDHALSTSKECLMRSAIFVVNGDNCLYSSMTF